MSLDFRDLRFLVPGHGERMVKGTIQARDRLVLRGASGCGKTTFLRVVAGLLPSLSGQCSLNGRDLTHLHPADRRVGFVFQSGALFPHLNVEKNVAFGLRFAPATRDWSEGLRDRRAREALEAFGLSALAHRAVSALSGGEKQRVALLRSLVIEPDFLLLDEPLSAVDPAQREEIGSWMIERLEARPVPTILVTHDVSEAKRLGTRVAEWKEGETCLSL